MMTPAAYARLLEHWHAACAKPVPKHEFKATPKYLKWLKKHKPRDYGQNPIETYFERQV